MAEPAEITSHFVNDDNDEDWITVSWGEEKYSPIQYHTVSVGPFIYHTKRMTGESIEDAFKRAHDFLDKMAARAFEVKRQGFKRRHQAFNE